MQQEQLQPRERDDAPITAAVDTHPDRALVAESVTINRPAQDLFEFWRDPTNLVQVMDAIRTVDASSVPGAEELLQSESVALGAEAKPARVALFMKIAVGDAP